MNNDNTDYVSNESGTLSRLFKLPQHGTTVRTELIAGMTTFLTMVYIVFVNPQILGAAQMDPKVVSAVLRWGYLLTYPWRWLRQWG